MQRAGCVDRDVGAADAVRQRHLEDPAALGVLLVVHDEHAARARGRGRGRLLREVAAAALGVAGGDGWGDLSLKSPLQKNRTKKSVSLSFELQQQKNPIL